MAGVNDSCAWDRGDLLSAYLDGELEDGELDIVVTHLESCSPCRFEFVAVREARTAVRILPELELGSMDETELHGGNALSAYLDGELDMVDVDAMTAHLATCAGCRDELHEIDAARTAIRSLRRLEVPAPAATTPGRARSLPRRLAPFAVAAALAAGLLGFVLRPQQVVEPLDLDGLAVRHAARASIESGFSVIPASSPAGTTP